MNALRFAFPYLTKDIPGIGGRIREIPEDFRVDEVPLYEPGGVGTHVYFRVRKAGVPTPAAVDRIARHMGVRAGEIGVAGLKDAHAVTTQMMSLEHADPQKLGAYHDSQVSVECVGLHTNKLRPGHLAANRFGVRIRGVGEEQLAAAGEILDVLTRRGVPNYFGRQRFGARGDTGKLGEALVKDDLAGFVAVYLGGAYADDPPDCKAARDAFDAGFFNRARDRWPRHYANERRALSAYKRKNRPGPAVAAIDRRMRRLYVSAFQSEMFNEIVARRIDTLDSVLAGDLARKTDTHGIFTVEDTEVDQPRAERFEISPTGAIFGYRTQLAEGEPGRIEREVLAGRGVELESFRRVGAMKVKGTRRALRFGIDETALTSGQDERGEFLELGFSAPSGCYATVLLREIMKDA